MEAIKDLQKNKDLYIETLLTLMKKYFWSIPSSTYKTIPDVPLYEHNKSTAAIACAIFNYYKETRSETALQDTEKSMIMCSIDLSGIQNYLYNLKKSGISGAGKILRSRSFYISYLLEVIQREILNRCSLPITNSLINAGGKIVLLLQNTPKAHQAIEDIKKMIYDDVFTKSYGLLSIVISNGIPVSLEDFKREDSKCKNFKKLMDKLHKELQKEKLTIGQQKIFSRDFNPVMDADYTKYGECQIQGNVPASYVEKDDNNNDGKKVCSDIHFQKILGKELIKNQYIHLRKNLADNSFLSNIQIKENIDTNQAKASKEEGNIVINQTKASQEEGNIYLKLNHKTENTEILPVKEMNNYVQKISQNDIFKYQEEIEDFELEEGGVAPFELLAKKNLDIVIDNGKEKKIGVELLGILKADVDNLGDILVHRLINSSLSKYLNISFFLNYFFTEILQEIQEKYFPNTYTVYSGGDDLVIVGALNEIIGLAGRINTEFKDFTKRKDITLSAGITAVHYNHPIRRGIEEADENLEKAKSYPNEENPEKNSICLLGSVIPFDEFDNYLSISNKLSELVRKGFISKAFLYRMLYYRQQLSELLNGLNISEYTGRSPALWKSQYAYDLERNVKDKLRKTYRIRQNEDIYEKLERDGKHEVKNDLEWLEQFFDRKYDREAYNNLSLEERRKLYEDDKFVDKLLMPIQFAIYNNR